MRDDITAWTVASVVADVLEGAELSLVPQNGYTRLHLAVRVAQETRAFLSHPTTESRTRLVYALELLRECESNCCKVDAHYPVELFPERQRQLDPDSIVGRGFALATHVGQTALAGVGPASIHCLNEARELFKRTEEVTA